MKLTFVNSILFLLSVAATCADEAQIDIDSLLDAGISNSADDLEDFSSITSSAEEDFSSRAIVQGRTETSECGDGHSNHYESPCEDNVSSNGGSMSGRNDPVTEPPTPTPPCVTSDGTFGSIVDDSNLIAVPFHYYYEMETVTGTGELKINNDILPILEKAIVDSILQEVFPEKCATTAFGKRNLRESQNRRHLEVVGVSMYPPDYVTVDSCDVLTGECSVVKGQLTMFTHVEEVEQEQARIESLIKEHMNSGEYNSVSEDIVELRYLDGSPNTSESNIEDGDLCSGAGCAENDGTNGLRVGLYVGLGALIAILAGVVFRITRRMRSNDDQTETQSGIVQEYLDVDRDRHSFN